MAAVASGSSSSAALPPAAASEEAILISFARSIFDILNSWEVLRSAIEHGWGGPHFDPSQLKTEIAEELVNAFQSAASSSSEYLAVPEQSDIAEFLKEVLEAHFELELEGGTESELSALLIPLWRECVAMRGATGGVLSEKFKSASEKARRADAAGSSRRRVEGDDSSSDDEDGSAAEEDEDVMDVEEQPEVASSSAGRRREEPVIDEDGFQMVPKRGGRR